MLDFLTNSLFFGVAVSLAAYEVGSLLKKKFKSPLLNPVRRPQHGLRVWRVRMG